MRKLTASVSFLPDLAAIAEPGTSAADSFVVHMRGESAHETAPVLQAAEKIAAHDLGRRPRPFLVLIYLRAGLETGLPDTAWLPPLGLSIPAGAVGGYLYTTLDPVRARGHGFVANIVGGAMYLVLLSAAFAVGINA